MTKKLSFLLFGLVLLLGIASCSAIAGSSKGWETIQGSGTVLKEQRNLDSFTGVELAMQGTLYIESGTSPSLRIEAEDNLMEYILSEVKDDKLVIGTPQAINLKNTQPINFYLTIVGIDEIDITSSGDVVADRLISGDFKINVSSSGNLSFTSLVCLSLQVDISSSGDVLIPELSSDSITVDISSSGNLELQAGEVPWQKINISSSGEYNAKDVLSTQAEVALSSSGSAWIQVSDSLTGRLSSSGNVYYSGNPTVDVSTSSSGKVVKIGE
jgi:hypothetical protein